MAAPLLRERPVRLVGWAARMQSFVFWQHAAAVVAAAAAATTTTGTTTTTTATTTTTTLDAFPTTVHVVVMGCGVVLILLLCVTCHTSRSCAGPRGEPALPHCGKTFGLPSVPDNTPGIDHGGTDAGTASESSAIAGRPIPVPCPHQLPRARRSTGHAPPARVDAVRARGRPAPNTTTPPAKVAAPHVLLRAPGANVPRPCSRPEPGGSGTAGAPARVAVYRPEPGAAGTGAGAKPPRGGGGLRRDGTVYGQTCVVAEDTSRSAQHQRRPVPVRPCANMPAQRGWRRGASATPGVHAAGAPTPRLKLSVRREFKHAARVWLRRRRRVLARRGLWPWPGACPQPRLRLEWRLVLTCSVRFVFLVCMHLIAGTQKQWHGTQCTFRARAAASRLARAAINKRRSILAPPPAAACNPSRPTPGQWPVVLLQGPCTCR